MDLTRLAPELRDHPWVRDDLFTVVHVAPPARREAHSGVAASLEDAERARPERHEEERAPAAVDVDQKHADQDHDAGGESRGAHEHPPPAAPWPDVLDVAGSTSAHRFSRRSFMSPFSARRPPSTYTVLPVMYDEASEARKTATSAISRGSATRCIGVRA